MMRLFLAALRFQEKHLFPYCRNVSFNILAILRKLVLVLSCHIQGHVVSINCVSCSAGEGVAGASGLRTDWVVFEHAQRLMRSRPLHCAVVARHGH
jgi:hypothetical protein